MGSPPLEQDKDRRDRVVGGSVSLNEEAEILAAFDQAGLPNKSRAARAVFLAFSRSTKVRDAVSAYLRENIEVVAA